MHSLAARPLYCSRTAAGGTTWASHVSTCVHVGQIVLASTEEDWVVLHRNMSLQNEIGREDGYTMGEAYRNLELEI